LFGAFNSNFNGIVSTLSSSNPFVTPTTVVSLMPGNNGFVLQNPIGVITTNPIGTTTTTVPGTTGTGTTTVTTGTGLVI
jgi:hypothetical protein